MCRVVASDPIIYRVEKLRDGEFGDLFQEIE